MKGTALLLVMVFVPAGPAAQDAATSLADLNRQDVLSEGDSIRLTFRCEEGSECEGLEAELVTLTESSIVVGVNEMPTTAIDLQVTPPSESYGKYAIEIPGDRVLRIEKRRSVRLWGTLVGAVGGGAWGAVAGRWAEQEGCDNCQLAMVVTASAAFAGIGYLIDRSRRDWEPVFLAHPESPGSPTFSFSPLVSKDRKGALFTVIW